jgi:hypothetical protein
MSPFARAESDPPILERADAIRTRPARLHHVRLDERCEIRNLIQGAMQCQAQTTFRSYRRDSTMWVKTMLLARIADSSETGETGGKSATGETDDGSRSEVRRFRNVELWVTPFSLLSRFTRHDLWRWRTLFFSILLGCWSYDGFFARILCGAKRASGAEDLFQGQEGIASRVPFDPSDQTLVGIGA